MDAAVSVRSLSKRFGRTLALDAVSFDVPNGSIFGLLGPNGAGKTTLFSIAAGFLKPTSGTIEVLGTDIGRISALRGRFSMLPQDAAFQGGIPVIEQLVMFARLNGYDPPEARRRSHAALDLVGLADVARRNARALSHGMMKRVQLCQAFLGEPEVIFLDEPTSGLDPENARKMRALVRDLRKDHTVILSSHNLREIQEICDHAAILHLGRLEICQSMEELTASAFRVSIRLSSALTPAAEADLRALPMVTDLVRSSDEAFMLSIDLPSMDTQETVLKQVQRTLVVDHDLVPRSVSEGESLETRFLELTGGASDGAGAT